MRCVGVIRIICIAAVLCIAGKADAVAEPALADTDDDWSVGLSGGSRPEHFLYFSGFDLWGRGSSGYGGLLWSPGGLNTDGFTLKLLLAGGTYLYSGGGNDFRGTYLLASILPGYRIKRGDVEIKLFGGLDLQHHGVSPDDPANSLKGNHVGARFNVDVWWEPIPASMMLTTSLTGSTIGSNYGVRGAAGCKVLDRFWAGPEIEASGDRIYRQYRIGAHITSLRFGEFEWAFGAGYVEDNSHRSGLYGRFSLLTRR
ncbi:MAG: cellulose biosynthesis protein BcsS [Afipia sp.]|nr:cellulose biosynthesis protein BcsS [Afipia sp.]OJW62964.1 MAG: cellulose biosynthesis protein BcsS [Afipia sp. 64-13]